MYIYINFPNGQKFRIPADFIATERTKYYAEVDGFSKGSSKWDEEMKQSMEPYELFDWISNNCDWSDVEAYAELIIDNNKPDYLSMWSDAEFEIKNK